MNGTPTTPDHAVDHHAPRWPRLVVVRALLPLGILGALALSAAATIDLAHRHGVPDHVQPAAVAMLEIVSAAGTLLAIFGDTGRLRGRAMVAVASASGVQLVAGVSAYGWFGAVAPIALVGLVHLAAEAWQELREEAATGSSTTSAPEADRPVAAVVEPVTSDDDAPSAEPAPVLDEQVAPPSLPRPTPAGPVHGPWPAPVGAVEGPLTLVDHLRALPDHERPSERVLLGELNEGVPEALKTTRHRVKGALREARTGLREVA